MIDVGFNCLESLGVDGCGTFRCRGIGCFFTLGAPLRQARAAAASSVNRDRRGCARKPMFVIIMAARIRAHVATVLFGAGRCRRTLNKVKIVVDMSFDLTANERNLQKRSTPAVPIISTLLISGGRGWRHRRRRYDHGRLARKRAFSALKTAYSRSWVRNHPRLGTAYAPDHQGRPTRFIVALNDCGGGRSSACCIESRGRSGTRYGNPEGSLRFFEDS